MRNVRDDRNRRPQREEFRFDSPPKDHELTKGIMAAAAQIGGGTIANAASILQSIQSMSMAQTAKIDRKLYVGNLPSGITQRMLIDVVNEAMLSLQVLEEPGNPVVSTWISSDGHYAFVEFRTAEEANLGFQLQGMNIQGYEIKIGRPKAYSGTMNALGVISQINSLQFDGKTQPLMGLKNIQSELEGATQGIQNPLMGGKMADELIRVTLPSRILAIRNIATLQDTKDDSNFSDLYSDVMDKCTLFGKVLDIKIPRPIWADRRDLNRALDEERERLIIDQHERAHRDYLEDQKRIEGEIHGQEGKKGQHGGGNHAPQLKLPPRLDPVEDVRNYDFPEGFGSAFVEFTSFTEARRARRGMHLGKYGTRVVECAFVEESKFERGEFGRGADELLIKIEKPSGDFEGIEKFAIDFNNDKA